MHGNSEPTNGLQPQMPGGPAQNLQDTAATPIPGVRQRLRAARRAMTSLQRQYASQQICAFLSEPGPKQWPAISGRPDFTPHIIAAFWPLAEEPDLRPALLQLVHQGYVVALPEVVLKNAPLIFRRWRPEAPMQLDQYGIPVPVGAPCTPDTLLVPTLGFTAQGDRLGYGAGYYDRTLALLAETGPTPLAIGIAFECCRLATTEHQSAPHDVRLAAIVTEQGWLATGLEG